MAIADFDEPPYLPDGDQSCRSSRDSSPGLYGAPSLRLSGPYAVFLYTMGLISEYVWANVSIDGVNVAMVVHHASCLATFFDT